MKAYENTNVRVIEVLHSDIYLKVNKIMYNVREFEACFFMYVPFLNVVAIVQQSLYGAFKLDTLHVLAVSQTPFQKSLSGFMLVVDLKNT